MTDGLRKSHLRKAPQVGLSEVGLPEGNRTKWTLGHIFMVVTLLQSYSSVALSPGVFSLLPPSSFWQVPSVIYGSEGKVLDPSCMVTSSSSISFNSAFEHLSFYPPLNWHEIPIRGSVFVRHLTPPVVIRPSSHTTSITLENLSFDFEWDMTKAKCV